MENIFRSLVAGSLALYAIYFSLPNYWYQLYAPEVLDALAWNGSSAIIPINDLIIYSIAALYCASSLGMLFFKRWARSLFVILTLFSIFASTLFGVYVYYGLGKILSDLMYMLDGAIIAMMFLTSINHKFK